MIRMFSSTARTRVVGLMLVAAVGLAACGGSGEGVDAGATQPENAGATEAGTDAGTGRPDPTSSPESVEVAEGWMTEVDESLTGNFLLGGGDGMTYGVLMAVKATDALQKKYPNATVEWFDVLGTSAQRDALLAGELNFGACSAPPLLLGWEAGVELRVVETIGFADIYWVANADGPDSIEDIIGTDASLSAGPGTAQYYATQAYLDSIGEDPAALDENWAFLQHADAAAALESGQLDVHVATSEWVLQYLKQDDKKVLLTGTEVFGAPFGICTMTLQQVVEEQPELVRAYQAILREGVDWAQENPDAFAEVLSADTGGEAPKENFLEQIEGEIAYPGSELGLKDWAELLTDLGVITREWSGPEDFYAFPEDAPANW